MFRRKIVDDLSPVNPKHQLAVLLPAGPSSVQDSDTRPDSGQLPVKRLRPVHILGLFLVFGVSAVAAGTQSGSVQTSIIKTLFIWTPLLLKGFGFNILISFMSMAIGTLIGACLGILQISL